MLWRWLYFDPVRFAADPQRSPEWNRGAYLVRHLGHCGNATARAMRSARSIGTRSSPALRTARTGSKVPNITPDKADGIGRWSGVDITYFLKTGFLPDGDVAGGAMTEVIDQSTSHLTDADRAAIAAYLRSLPPRSGP